LPEDRSLVAAPGVTTARLRGDRGERHVKPPPRRGHDPPVAHLAIDRGRQRAGAVLVACSAERAPPPGTAARADEKGREGVELVCKSCPDGTKLTIAGTSGTTMAA